MAAFQISLTLIEKHSRSLSLFARDGLHELRHWNDRREILRRVRYAGASLVCSEENRQAKPFYRPL